MSDEPDKSAKTEDPSQKKLDDAHKKGDVAKSQEVTNWFMIARLDAAVRDHGADDSRPVCRPPARA